MELFWKGLERSYPRNQVIMEKGVAEQLPSLKGKSVLFVPNHVAQSDSIAVGSWLNSLQESNVIGRVTAVVSSHYLNLLKSPALAVSIRSASLLSGVKVTAVNQVYRREEETNQVGPDREFVRQVKRIVENKDCLVLFPEGHRSESKHGELLNHGLQPASNGVYHLVKKFDVAVPVGIVCLKEAGRGFNIGAPLTLKIGQPFNQGDLAKDITDLREKYGLDKKQVPDSVIGSQVAMLRIGALLPERMQGVFGEKSSFGPESKRLVLAGEIKLAEQSDGRVLPERISIRNDK